LSEKKTGRGDLPSGSDVTVLRLDPSNSETTTGNGRATPPKVLKQRFVLDVQLGSGGMGTVFKAKDLRKVEARDRNPYLAIKVLNNDFRKHPEAFIALQREASKSQALSHPNIVSIFDFDKEGDTPFMTMELLEGNELAKLIKKYPDGMPDELAWSIIADMCAGLKRAHDAGITHADFKPGNVFVCRDRTTKILDFGIARAVSFNRRRGDDTVFDPSRLAALTPAYASLEMLDGQLPEPADDIYSLGIVIYQILSGRHPYERVSADLAEKEKLQPERLERLSRRKWNVLKRILAFRREDRPADMSELIAKLLQPLPLWYWFAGAAIAAVMLVGLSMLVVDATNINSVKQTAALDALVDAQITRIDELVQAPVFDSYWEEKIAEELMQLRTLDKDNVSLNRVKQSVLDLYKSQVASTEDFETAFDLVSRADLYAPNSFFKEGRTLLQTRLKLKIERLLGLRVIPPDWLERVQAAVERYEQFFPDSPETAFLKHESGQALLASLPELLEQGDIRNAQRMFEKARELIFDYDALQTVGAQIDRAHALTVKQETELLRVNEIRDYELAISKVRSNLTCQGANLSQYKLAVDKLVQRFPAYATSARREAVAAVAQCVQEVGEFDQDRAMSIKRSAIQQFGPHALLNSLEIDPCAMLYLIGAGREPGRSGYCRDSTIAEVSTPRMVVVSKAGNQRFAIAKQEVSWNELTDFCIETGQCETSFSQNLPVTSMSRETASLYAAWLSTQTGYTYRLPSHSEWELATSDEDRYLDPNRNCQIEVAGIERGQSLASTSSGEENMFGLLHTAGNVQEWVSDNGQWVVVGGSFIDPISDCSARTTREHDGNADKQTGFRLVREIL